MVVKTINRLVAYSNFSKNCPSFGFSKLYDGVAAKKQQVEKRIKSKSKVRKLSNHILLQD